MSSKATEWASKSLNEVFKELDTDPDKGLSIKEAEIRLKKFGENELVKEKEEGFLDALKEEITEPMILLLLSVGVLYSIWGSLLDAVTIFSVIITLVLAEVINESKAERGVEALKMLASPSTAALREGKLGEISPTQLVPGDILPLNVGERIPADCRLVKSYGLQLDESSLTGESFPVFKDAEAIQPEKAGITELTNTVFAGTLITQGEGLAVVTTTGRDTELGRVAKLAEEAEEPKTPLQATMEDLTKVLVWFALFFSILIPVLSYLRGQDLKTMVLTGLSLAFVVIPEELPIIITMALAVGTIALSHQNALVKRLRAAETLGSVTVIAADKTGTITENSMSLGHLYSNNKLTSGVESDEEQLLVASVLAIGALTSLEYEKMRYLNPMGLAILDAAQKAGVEAKELRNNYSLQSEFSFDNKLKLASYIYQHGKSLQLFASGAPEAILERSTKILKKGKEAPLTGSEKAKITKEVNDIALMGERTLAIAYRKLKQEKKSREDLEKNLVFAGVISFIDPPRPGVGDVVHTLQGAGIRVVMLTGDHPDTAKAVASQVGIDSSQGLLTGPEISAMDEDQFKDALKKTSIYARITPEHKLRIVRLLNGMGEVVAVTGDGVNDAPALHEAAIGIAMGVRGTDVAKESADMILTDDNFVTIGNAVREGRRIFDNLKKGFRYYLAVKVALVAIFLLPIVLAIPLPFPPIQIILLELFMDLAASAGFVAECSEFDVMRRPPRNPREKFVNRSLIAGIVVSALTLFVAVSICYLLTYYQTSDLVHAQSVAFSAWIFTHIFLAFNLRSERQSLFRIGFFSNRAMIVWALSAILMIVLVTTVPILQALIMATNLSAFDWMLVISVSFVSTFWLEVAKGIQRSRSSSR
jgi:Ca2+-transporting ATPase